MALNGLLTADISLYQRIRMPGSIVQVSRRDRQKTRQTCVRKGGKTAYEVGVWEGLDAEALNNTAAKEQQLKAVLTSRNSFVDPDPISQETGLYTRLDNTLLKQTNANLKAIGLKIRFNTQTGKATDLLQGTISKVCHWPHSTPRNTNIACLLDEQSSLCLTYDGIGQLIDFNHYAGMVGSGRQCLCDILAQKEEGELLKTVLPIEAKGAWQVRHNISKNYAEILASEDWEERKQVMLPCAQALMYTVRNLLLSQLKPNEVLIGACLRLTSSIVHTAAT